MMAAVAHVLLVEDDPGLAEGLDLALTRQGHRVVRAATGEDGVDRVRAARPDVVVLDVMLPGIDGFEVCRRVRALGAAGGTVPILMLTARADDFDVVAGLEAGADDYVAKPVEPRVLDARIRALLRRVDRVGAPAAPARRAVFGDLVVDREALVVTRAGRPVELTPTELRLLLVLSAAPERVFSRGQLLEQVWDQDFLGDSRLVDACVQRLRAKIEDVPASPVLVQTVRGFGYRLGPL